MGIESGPSFGSFDRVPAVERIGRFNRAALFMGALSLVASEALGERINRDKQLEALMSKLIESGPELDPDYKAHLKRMVALRIGSITDAIVQANSDREFYDMAANMVQDELQEMLAFNPDLTDLPDLWDVAYQELMQAEGGDTTTN